MIVHPYTKGHAFVHRMAHPGTRPLCTVSLASRKELPMTDRPDNFYSNDDSDDIKPPAFAYCADEVADQIIDAEVDLSWMTGYDIDHYDALELFLLYWVLRTSSKEEDSVYASETDVLMQAGSISKSLIYALYSFRRNTNEKSLLLLMSMVSEEAYKHGLRDATEGRISTESTRKIIESYKRMENGFDKMRELYDDIREV